MPLLEVQGLDAFYGDFQALFGIDLEIDDGEVIALIGANGAGKSTFMRALLNHGIRAAGHIRFGDADITQQPTYLISRLGMTLAPEGRALFPSLSAEENLVMGTSAGRGGRWTLADIYQLFPGIRDARQRTAMQISGGQQQMVAICRALLANPRLLLCDEISLGLAPKVISDIYNAVPTIRESGIAILLVEQDIDRARSVSDRFYCLLEGRVSLKGRSADYSMDAISRAYFGA